METYRVVSITDRKGNPRIEGRYPLRVTEACETVNGKFLGVSYPNEDTAVILYRWSDGLH